MLCFVLRLDLAVLLLEALNAACSVDELLFAGKKWMAVIADFDAERIFRCGRTSRKLITAAGTVHEHCMIIGMNAFFHCFLSETDGFCRHITRATENTPTEVLVPLNNTQFVEF